ncbi:MAG: N-6 DNA methylase [Ignavibacteriaceae bacterium]
MSPKNIKTNERELASKVSEWINENIKRNNYPFTTASVETGIKVDAKTRFGDIIIWKNIETRDAYSYLELKPPLGNSEDLDTFRQKAIELKVKYAFTWDFQNLRAYKINKNEIELAGTETEVLLNNIDEWIRGDYQTKIRAYTGRILEELVNLNEKGKLRRFYPDKVYFINFIRKAVETLIPKYEHFLKEESRKEKNKKIIAEYAVKQGIAYPSDADYFKLIARQNVYGLITRLIFYLTIRRYFKDLPDLFSDDEKNLNDLLKSAFNKAREKDWQAVFVEDPIELLGIPETAFDDLQLFFSELQVYHFGELPEDVIGQLFEEIIDPKERHLLGQYFTNENLVDLILGFAVQNVDGIYGDPTCGSGTFLIRLYDRLRYLSAGKLNHKELLGKIWGIDIGKFPAELSTINLFRQNVSNYENFPRVICSDIFDITKGDKFKFPPPNASQYFDKIEITLPEFKGFVGNFPFIRQELIEKKVKGYKNKLTKVLAYEYLISHPKLFKVTGINESHKEALLKYDNTQLKTFIDNAVDKNHIELNLSGQADIYTYIYLHTATLLAAGGRFAIITSNSWLDVSYGSVLKEFFLDNFKIKAIIASWAEPWFEDAAVNTVVTVLEKKSINQENVNEDANLVRFVKLKKKLVELIPHQNLKLESAQRWQKIDRIVDLIETAEYQNGLKQVTASIQSFETDDLRIRLVPQNELQKELLEKSDLAKWNKYLRAPDVYFELLDKCKDKLVPLKDIAEVRFGIKTGVNEFFYLEPQAAAGKKSKGMMLCKNARNWQGEIEEKYLKSVIKSPKESQSIIIDPEKLKYRIFICNKSKAELKKEGDIGALKYIEWGEKQRTTENILWMEVPSVQGRKYWWGIETKNFADLLWPKAFNDRFPIIINDDFLAADRLYELTLKKKYLKNKSAVILNSTLQYLFIEMNSRVNLGEGALDNMTYEAELCETINPQILKELKFERLFKRSSNSIFQEVKQKDRKELDYAILKALGLNPEEYLPKIYEGLCELVKERLELPKMRKKQKTQTVKVAYDQVKKAVIEDILPNGIKQFPEAFYTKGNYDQLKFEEHASNGKPLKSESFFNQFELKDETGKTILAVDSETKAEFAEIMSHKEAYQIKIPVDEKAIEKILSSYKKYIKQLIKDIEQNAHEKLHDWNLAEKMAKEIWDEWG